MQEKIAQEETKDWEKEVEEHVASFFNPCEEYANRYVAWLYHHGYEPVFRYEAAGEMSSAGYGIEVKIGEDKLVMSLMYYPFEGAKPEWGPDIQFCVIFPFKGVSTTFCEELDSKHHGPLTAIGCEIGCDDAESIAEWREWERRQAEQNHEEYIERERKEWCGLTGEWCGRYVEQNMELIDHLTRKSGVVAVVREALRKEAEKNSQDKKDIEGDNQNG